MKVFAVFHVVLFVGAVAPWVELGGGFLGKQALGFCALINVRVRTVSRIDFFPECRSQELTSLKGGVNANGQFAGFCFCLIAHVGKIRIARFRANNFLSAVKNGLMTESATGFVFNYNVILFGDEGLTIA